MPHSSTAEHRDALSTRATSVHSHLSEVRYDGARPEYRQLRSACGNVPLPRTPVGRSRTVLPSCVSMAALHAAAGSNTTNGSAAALAHGIIIMQTPQSTAQEFPTPLFDADMARLGSSPRNCRSAIYKSWTT